MANCTYVGNAAKVAQVITATPGGTWEIGDLVVVTFGTKIYTYAVTSATIATWVPLFVTAWNALSAANYPEFFEITASGTTTIVLTCKTAGRRIAPVLTTTESDGSAADAQTLSQSTTTANSGPEDWDNAQNWSGGAVPVDTDVVYLDGAICNVDIKYGLNQTGIQLAALYVINEWSGQLGLPERNTDGSGEYDEYRTTELTADITTLDVHSSSGRIKINGQAVQCAATVRATGASDDTLLPALQWRGTHAANTLEVHAGSVGVALKATEAATIATLRQSGGSLVCSSGVTLTTVQKSGGTLTIESATTALTNDSGDVTINGSGAHAAITNSGGTCFYNSSGTITAYTGNKSSAISFDGRNVVRTLTNATLNDEASLVDSNRTVTHSNAVQVFGPVGTRVSARRQYNVTPV